MSNYAGFMPGVPLYRQVQNGIENLIRTGSSKKPLPLTDAQLAERFGVSRITVRRAVDELVDAGVLYRLQGVGTFVRPGKLSEKLTLNSFLDSWTRKDLRSEVRVGAFEQVPANAELAENLNVRVGDTLVYVQRLRFQKKALVAIDDRYMRARILPQAHHPGYHDVLARRLSAQPKETHVGARRDGD